MTIAAISPVKKNIEIPKELDERLFKIEDALTKCFGGYRVGENDNIFVDCCGEVTYGCGIIGSDIVRCHGCGRKVINVLSPHVSPLLINGSTTSIPSQEMLDAIGERCWIVIIPGEKN